MKQMQCNATPSLNIKTTTKQIWLHFIRRTAGQGYVGTTANLQFVLNPKKIPSLIISHPKNTCLIFLLKNIPESKISNPKKPFNHP